MQLIRNAYAEFARLRSEGSRRYEVIGGELAVRPALTGAGSWNLGTRALEVWRLAKGATAPEVLGGGASLEWTPVSGGPPLHVAVGRILAYGGGRLAAIRCHCEPGAVALDAA